MSQNLERLFALEGGAKRRGAKKGSKKASKGKKAMRGGALTYNECVNGMIEKGVDVDTVDMNTKASEYYNKLFNTRYAGSANPFCRDIKALHNKQVALGAEQTKKQLMQDAQVCRNNIPLTASTPDKMKLAATRGKAIPGTNPPKTTADA